VSLIEASPNKAGTAYVAVENYLQDDRAPYIYKTDDYGSTWKKIINGIQISDYVHAVREDPKRAGLLYAGTEHGVYISFDDGESWQSLSLNLPDTQVSDIEVENHDFIIATHGRSFYVLDKISPLRQLTSDVVKSAGLHLYVPEDPMRRAHPLMVDYYLKNKADKVTIEILDAHGAVIRSYNSQPEGQGRGTAAEAGDEEGFRPPPVRIGVNAGLNRFTWNLRYPGATVFPGMVLWSANVNEGPLAVPGAYQVRVTANGETQTQSFHITEDPRVTISQADLQASFDLAKQVLDKVSQANQAVIDVRRLREQIADRLKKSDAAAIHSAGDALAAKLTGVEEAVYQVRNRSSQDPLNFPIKLNNKIGHLLEVIEGGQDAKPTDQIRAAFKELSGELDTQLANLKAALTTDLPAFNAQLAAVSLQPVSLGAAAK
jgi:hypothetical protein